MWINICLALRDLRKEFIVTAKLLYIPLQIKYWKQANQCKQEKPGRFFRMVLFYILPTVENNNYDKGSGLCVGNILAVQFYETAKE